jgi:hypothetical protein
MGDSVDVHPTTLAYYHDGGAAKTEEIEAIWKDADADGNGTLDRSEVGRVIRLLQVPDDVAALDQAMVELDKDADGNIVFEEFATWYLQRDESAEQIETTVAGLAELAATGTLDDETYVWIEGLGDDWLQYRHAKERVAGLQAAGPRAHVLPTAMACYHAEVDGDESGERIETTVAGLAELAATGTLDDETYVWIEGLGDDWLKYGDVKKQLMCGDCSTPPSSQRNDDPKPANASVTFDVIVPDGVKPGDTITLDLADGREVDVIIPDGHGVGDEFEVELDTSEATTPMPWGDAEDATEGLPDVVMPTPVPKSEPAALADSVQPQSQCDAVTLNVTCPEGVGSGETIAIQYEQHAFDVQVPDGVTPGDEFEVQIEI